MRERVKVSATIAGKITFITQVSDLSSLDPNFRPAMKIKLARLGNRASSLRSSKSHAMVSMP